jgi:hypothetical protein
VSPWQTQRRFPHAAVALVLHLQRDPPQTVEFRHRIERAGHRLDSSNFAADIAPADAAPLLGQPQAECLRISTPPRTSARAR